MLGFILAGAGLALEIGKSIAGHNAQKKASEANKAAALAAMADEWKSLSLNESQQQDATQMTIMQIDRQMKNADALARVSAGESGVSGASVEALLGDIEAQAATAKTTERRNLDMTIAQLQGQKIGARTTAQSRINGVPMPNPWATGLQIASAGLDFATSMLPRIKPPKGNVTNG